MKAIIREFCRNIRLRRSEKERLLETEGIFRYAGSQKGFVLIIVLLVSAMLITVSGQFFMNTQTNISYMSNFKNEAQALELARAGLSVSIFMLEADRTGKAGSILPGINTNSNIDSYKDIWAIDFPELPVENGKIKTVIRDEQSKINLSIIATEFDITPYYNIAKRLLFNMGFPEDFVDSIKDWIDPDQNKSGYGAESFDYYSTLPRPYSAKNAPLDSIDELLMIKGITPEIFYGFGGGNIDKEKDLVPDNMFIKPLSLDLSQNNRADSDLELPPVGKEKSRSFQNYFRAYGSNEYAHALNKININTAPFRVLSALTATITDDKVTELIRRRPFNTVDEAIALFGDDTVKNYTTVSSSIFSISSTGYFNGQKVTIFAVYNRADKQYYYYGIQ
ncbi:MAG: general secretion pathway protein GspK [Spirochaetota bacterium]